MMGNGSIRTPKGKFHHVLDISAMFSGRPTPPPLCHKSAWWHFMGVTVSGGTEELLTLYDNILGMLYDLAFDNFPVVEAPAEQLTEELLEDLALLWPALVEQG